MNLFRLLAGVRHEDHPCGERASRDCAGRRGISGKLAALTAVGGTLLVAIVALPGAKALDRPGTITISDSELRHAHVDAGPIGRSAGDLDIYTLRLFNKRIRGNAIGRATMVCTAVGGPGQSCNATYSLPKGAIVVQGLITTRLIYELPVIGGTGLYNNVRGSVTVTSLKRKPSQELLVFRLTV
jgi:hypothetical protein